jgi:hypothetical protein
VDRLLPAGEHSRLVLPALGFSHAMVRIAALFALAIACANALARRIRGDCGRTFVHVDVPCIVVSEGCFRSGTDRVTTARPQRDWKSVASCDYRWGCWP